MSVTYESYHATNAFGTDLVSSSSANTKGSYVQYTAACGLNITKLIFAVRFYTQNTRYLVDIATGAAASETVVVASIMVTGSNTHGITHGEIYVAIANGTRIAGRCQGLASGSNTINTLLVGVTGDAASVVGSGVTHTYGDVTGSTDGTAVDSGGTASTKGSYVQFIAATSTTNPIYSLAACWRPQNASSAEAFMFDIATGAGGSETVIVPDITLTSETNNYAMNGNQIWTFDVNIPNGTRIAVREMCGSNASPDRINNGILIATEGVLSAGGTVFMRKPRGRVQYAAGLGA